jgi:hypothetical protein
LCDLLHFHRPFEHIFFAQLRLVPQLLSPKPNPADFSSLRWWQRKQHSLNLLALRQLPQVGQTENLSQELEFKQFDDIAECISPLKQRRQTLHESGSA